jgi:hypothetical protein
MVRVIFHVCLAVALGFAPAYGKQKVEAPSDSKTTPKLALPHKAQSTTSKGSGVKWWSGDNSGEHASAPRSQKYWNEHGLNDNKPNYAKTDSEVLAETWGKWAKLKGLSNQLGATVLKIIVVLLTLAVGASFVTSHNKSNGTTLGGGGGPKDLRSIEEIREQERSARLARFEGKSSGTYADAMAQAMGKDVD